MTTPRRKRELARADRVLPGLWRLRLPLPWPVVPHVNAWAIAAGSGVVLVDTGLDRPGALGQLSSALQQASMKLEHVRLLVCTHAHPDHYGLAAPIVEATGCELWMHPAHGHATRAAEDPDAALTARLELLRGAGAPEHLVGAFESGRRGGPTGVAGVIGPDRDLLPGVTIETDLGTWDVHETPGHAPSHVCLHQPERDLLISGDHLLGRVSLYYDYGYTDDPVGEFLEGMDRVDALDARLCLSGHGRPFRDVRAHVEANRSRVEERMGLVRGALENGPRTPFECLPALVGIAEPEPLALNWVLTETLCYLRRLEVSGLAERIEGSEPASWQLA